MKIKGEEDLKKKPTKKGVNKTLLYTHTRRHS